MVQSHYPAEIHGTSFGDTISRVIMVTCQTGNARIHDNNAFALLLHQRYRRFRQVEQAIKIYLHDTMEDIHWLIWDRVIRVKDPSIGEEHIQAAVTS